jgi:hypothetical protein
MLNESSSYARSVSPPRFVRLCRDARSATVKPSPLTLRQQVVPRATQGFLKPDHGGHQDIDPARFDFLDSADVEVHEFRKTFLRHGPLNPFATDVRAQLLQLLFDAQVSRHALLGRKSFLTVTAQWGVIGAAAKEISL